LARISTKHQEQLRYLSDLQQTFDILHRRSESISFVMSAGNEQNRFSRAVAALEKLGQEHQIPLAIVGGLGAIRYGYAAATEDIDIAVGSAHLNTLLELAPAYGLRVVWQAQSGWHTLAYGDVEINIVPEGGKARDDAPTTIPGPPELGVELGLDYASLAGWFELKVSSGRQKDLGHMVEVLKKIDAQQAEQVNQHLGRVHSDYQRSFQQLVLQAAKEKEQERRRE
jgi:hypothetical protein